MAHRHRLTAMLAIWWRHGATTSTITTRIQASLA